MASDEYPQTLRNLERVKFLLYGGLIAAIATAPILLATGSDMSSSSTVITLSLYLVAALTVFQRPATGSIERCVLLAKMKIGAIGLGMLGAAGIEFVVLEGYIGGTIFLVIGTVAFYILIREDTWHSYKERCYRTVETYNQAADEW